MMEDMKTKNPTNRNVLPAELFMDKALRYHAEKEGPYDCTRNYPGVAGQV